MDQERNNGQLSDPKAGLTPEATRIREQIEETRAQVSGTIEELQDRLRPQNIAHQAGEAVREAMESRVHSAVASASDAGRRLASTTRTSARVIRAQVQDRPGIAMGIAGLVGLAVVMAARSRRDDAGSAAWDDQSSTWQDDGGAWRDDDEALQQDDAWADDGTTGRMLPGLLAGAAGYYALSRLAMRHPEAVSRVTGAVGRGTQAVAPARVATAVRAGARQVGESMGTLQEKAGVLGQQAKAHASTVVETMEERLRRLGGAVRNHAEQGSTIMSERTQQAGQTASRWMEENPLVLGAAAFALGAIAGMSMPRIEAAQPALGKARDTLMNAAGRAVDKVAG